MSADVPRDLKPLSDEELQVLAKLKEHLGPEREGELEMEGYIRFIRGYQTENPRIEKTIQFMDACLAWRKKVEAATLLERELPKRDEFLKAYPTFIAGQDRHDRPIICFRLQDIDVATVVAMPLEVVEPLEGMKNERILLRKKDIREMTGKMIYQHVAVVDMTGIGWNLLSNRSHLQSIAQVGNGFYPETVAQIVLVNCPMIMRMLWSTIKMFLHPLTAAKVQMLSGQGHSELAKLGIPKDQLPSSFGGSFQLNYMHSNKDGSSWP